MAAPTPQSGNFSSIPTLDYTLRHTNRPLFLSQLRHALINVGFLYLSHHPIPSSLISSLEAYIPRLFALPQDEKERVRMIRSPHFLGYSRFGAELTKGNVDRREQFDFATEHQTRWREEGRPEYYRLWGASQASLLYRTRNYAYKNCSTCATVCYALREILRKISSHEINTRCATTVPA